MKLSVIFLFVSYVLMGLDHPCSNPPCLPNAVLLAAGIDLSTGDPTKGQVLDLSWSNNSYYYNPNNNIWYEIPYGVTVNPLSASSDTEGTFLFSQTLDVEQWQASAVTKSYLGGMFSHSTMTYQQITSQYQQTRDTGYVIKKMAVYNVIIPASEMKLSPECQKNVDLLPDDYNQQMYLQFIYTYGTHVSNYSMWGVFNTLFCPTINNVSFPPNLHLILPLKFKPMPGSHPHIIHNILDNLLPIPITNHAHLLVKNLMEVI